MTSSLAYVRSSHHVIMARSKFCRSFGASSILHFTRFFHPDTPGMYRAIFHHSSLYMIKISQIRSFRESSPSNSIQTIDERAKMPFLGCMTFVERFICKKMFVKSSANVHCSALGSSHSPAKLSTVCSGGIEVATEAAVTHLLQYIFWTGRRCSQGEYNRWVLAKGLGRVHKQSRRV
jgi:hypothetical protein